MQANAMLCALAIAVMANVATAAPPTIGASFNLVSFTDVKCDATTCAVIVKNSTAISHTLDITEVQEAALVAGTTVTIGAGLPIEIGLSEDPNFQNGDTSAKIQKIIPVTDGTRVITGKVKWGNGKLTVSATDVTNVKSPPALPKSVVDGKDTKAISTQVVQTTIQTEMSTVLDVTVTLKAAVKAIVKVYQSAEDDQLTRVFTSVRAKEILEP
jgi:hypothetical protein